jgi:hypothetical protein
MNPSLTSTLAALAGVAIVAAAYHFSAERLSDNTELRSLNAFTKAARTAMAEPSITATAA